MMTMISRFTTGSVDELDLDFMAQRMQTDEVRMMIVMMMIMMMMVMMMIMIMMMIVMMMIRMMTIMMVMVMVMVSTLIKMMIIAWSGDQRVGCEQEEASTGESI